VALGGFAGAFLHSAFPSSVAVLRRVDCLLQSLVVVWTELTGTLAADPVPERPGWREPGVVERKKNKYSGLDAPRRRLRDLHKRNVRGRIARLRKLGLM